MHLIDGQIRTWHSHGLHHCTLSSLLGTHNGLQTREGAPTIKLKVTTMNTIPRSLVDTIMQEVAIQDCCRACSTGHDSDGLTAVIITLSPIATTKGNALPRLATTVELKHQASRFGQK
mmetsp:Transcript_38233/g.88302  ORF Transcript_38233/g.88302 Transcript_38233/m.88302 type:complete len:118 (+) Transcript_38233:33-386(+)